MQAASIVMSMLSEKAPVPGNSLTGKSALDASPTFTQTLAEKLSSSQAPPQKTASAPSSALLPKAASTANGAVPASQKTPKKIDSPANGVGAQHSQPDVNSATSIAMVIPVLNPTIPTIVPDVSVESATTPQQADNSAVDSTGTTLPGGSAIAKGFEYLSQALPVERSPQGLATSQLQPPTEQAAIPLQPKELENSDAVLAPQTDVPPQSNENKVPEMLVTASTEMSLPGAPAAQELPVTSASANSNLTPHVKPGPSSETVSGAALTQLQITPCNEDTKDQTTLPALPQKEKTVQIRNVPERNSAQVALPAIHLSVAASKATTVKDVVGTKDNAAAETIEVVVGAAANIASKTAQQGNPGGHDSTSQDTPEQKAATAHTKASPDGDGPSPIETAPPPDLPPESSNQATILTSAPIAFTAPAIHLTSSNATTDVPPSVTNGVPTPALNEHTTSQVAQNGIERGSSTQADASTRNSQNLNLPAPPGNTWITNAQISGNTAQSEIHLAMQGDKLGSVELHARLTGEQVGAAIIVEKRETHAALAVELPALQQALSDKNLRVEHVWLTQSALHSSAGDPGNTSDQHSRAQHRPGSIGDQKEQLPSFSLVPSMEGNDIFDDRGRLSVRA